ncbi:MAG: beta-lactamase family protein [Alphaproteobacteria bacterium]|nr:beta-lactamase family protein [Alphaproteobacteria bacterium]
MAPVSPESVGFSSERLSRLTSAMHDAVDRKEVAGIVTLVARHGRVVLFDAYGKKSLASGEPMTKDAIFRIYSQSKPLTGAAMMILFEEGKWRLDDPVTKFVPEFAKLKVLSGVDKDGKPILEDPKHLPTMRELMTHTAGFGYGLANDNYVDQQYREQHVLSSSSLKAMIDKIAAIPLRYQPGTRWSYSVAVDIQGYIIEKLSGQRLSDFMAERLFRPLGMNDTGFIVPGEKRSRLASVYALNPQTGALVEVTPAMDARVQDFTLAPPMDSGGGGALSTASDYARFCQMVLNRGSLNGFHVLSPATVALMESDAVEDSVVPGPPDEEGPPIGGRGVGFALDYGLVKDSAALGTLAANGSLSWGGAAGTWFWIDPKNDLFFLGMIQRYGEGAAGSENLNPLSQTLVYSALLEPSK